MFKALVVDSEDEGVILIRGVPFGGPQDRDIHGQFFTSNTNFLAHVLPLPPIFHFHGAKSGSLTEQIGETLSREQRRDGVWYKAKLYIDSQRDAVKTKAIQLWEAAKAGRLFASSGAVEATIKISDTGEIVQWLVGELSLIDTRNNRENPANFHATVQPLKADLDGVETGDVTINTLQLPVTKTETDTPNVDNEGITASISAYVEGLYNTIRARFPDNQALQELMLNNYRNMFGVELNPITRSAKMSDENNTELFAQLQAQIAEMTTNMATLQTQLQEQQGQIQQRDTTIAELQGVISTKSAEVAMGTHAAQVDAWIKDGKLTPAEREPMLEVLSFAFQADTSTKGQVGFVESVKGLIEARPVNPTYGSPSTVYNNTGLNGGVTEGPGGGVDPNNVARLKRYAEITE